MRVKNCRSFTQFWKKKQKQECPGRNDIHTCLGAGVSRRMKRKILVKKKKKPSIPHARTFCPKQATQYHTDRRQQLHLSRAASKLSYLVNTCMKIENTVENTMNNHRRDERERIHKNTRAPKYARTHTDHGSTTPATKLEWKKRWTHHNERRNRSSSLCLSFQTQLDPQWLVRRSPVNNTPTSVCKKTRTIATKMKVQLTTPTIPFAAIFTVD